MKTKCFNFVSLRLQLSVKGVFFPLLVDKADLKINTHLPCANKKADKFKPILISASITIFLDSFGNNTMEIAIRRLAVVRVVD